MEYVELSAIQPADYLKDGFFNEKGEIREGINGEYSLAMAYRLREENVDPDHLKKLVDELQEIALRPDSAIDENPELSLDPEAVEQVETLAKKWDSPTLQAIFKAARPWLKDWKTLSAFALHLQRILSQYVLIRTLPQE